jgi:hypothetical protein
MSDLSTQAALDLTKFFRLTIDSELSPIEIAEAIEYVNSAATHPEYADILEHITEPTIAKNLLRNWAVVDWLDDEGLVAKSDKLDEFHEAIGDLFAEGLPPFAEWSNDNLDCSLVNYYAWLDGLVAKFGDKEHGGYELLAIDPSRDDNYYAIAVERNRTVEILRLGRNLGIKIDRLKNPGSSDPGFLENS